MEESEPILIPSFGSPISPGHRYFKRTSHDSADTEAGNTSDLLRSIKAALRGPGKKATPRVHSQILNPSDKWTIEEELTWDDKTVVWSTGGIQRRKWTFDEGEQQIQYACIGLYMGPGAPRPESMFGLSSPTQGDKPKGDKQQQQQGASLSVDSDKNPFGPYASLQKSRDKTSEPLTLTRALYVFLRSTGKMFVLNGMEHTFSLPFIVRKAWPLYPHGVLIQRVLDDVELEEAEITGEFALPTLFTITNPFAEPRAVGVTEGIVGGFAFIPPTLKPTETDVIDNKPLQSVPADEHVLWVSQRSDGAVDDIMVTIDAQRRHLSIWHYVHAPPKDIPVPLGRRQAQSLGRRRTSMSSGVIMDSRRTPAVASQEETDRADRMVPPSPDVFEATQPVVDFADVAPLGSLPGMPQSLSAQSTLLSLTATGSMPSSQWTGSGPTRPRRNSLTRTELSATMDRISLNGRSDPDGPAAAADIGRMKAAFWAERLHKLEITETDSSAWEKVSFAIFDQRFDGEADRSLLGICLPGSKRLLIAKIMVQKDKTLRYVPWHETTGTSITAIKATRRGPWDLLVVKPEGELVLLTHGVFELKLEVRHDVNGPDMSVEATQMSIDEPDAILDISMGSIVDRLKVVSLRNPHYSGVTLVFEDGSLIRTSINLTTSDELTSCCLEAVANIILRDQFFALHKRFLEIWNGRQLSLHAGVEFSCFSQALLEFLGLDVENQPDAATTPPFSSPWEALHMSESHQRLMDDTALSHLSLPPVTPKTPSSSRPPIQKMQGLILLGLHTVGEEFRFLVHRHQALFRLVPLLCRLAEVIRPEYVDYWKRLCPAAIVGWPALSEGELADSRLPSWPPDLVATLFGRLCNTDGNNLPLDPHRPGNVLRQHNATGLGYTEPFSQIRDVDALYRDLLDQKVNTFSKRAENTISRMVRSNYRQDYLNLLPVGIAAPLREAARTCQLVPPLQWPLIAYELVGRNDISEGAIIAGDCVFNDGYRSAKDHMNPKKSRKSFDDLTSQTRKAIQGDTEHIRGTELDLGDFTQLRFSQDRRLQEVQSMLCSAYIPSMKSYDRPELNEHDLAKEHQAHTVRVADRTLALPFGRAMLTFGTVPSVTKEAYTVPKIELSVRLQPQNVVMAPELGKIAPEAMHWAEFHNGVASALRISPSSGAVDSSWITFNKPNELTPEHAGFLFGLGLSGHLKNMLSWHTFGYLTPKHDLTSIGVLLGLSAAHAGTGNRHVSKLLAVHTPALLPTQAVDLNVPLPTQAAGLIGVGLLHLGSKDRHVAEVTLQQISRGDLLQPGLSNEHREAYTIAAALAFGMVMVGKGSAASNPADLSLLSRLRVLIHGELPNGSRVKPTKPSFDINLTSPAASIALGLMYLRTNRQEVADILTIPSTVLALNHMQPNFLMTRAIARAMIMWDDIIPNNSWLKAQVPDSIGDAMVARLKGQKVDDALELAYYHIMAGACFGLGLKYAGTANADAFHTVIPHHDLYTRLHHASSGSFESKIKRAAIRDGLNMMSLALNMIMAGTGDLNSLRRTRFAHGAVYSPNRYGCHVAIHMSMGLLFLGGGRFTLGTSDAAIACMMTAFYPRFPPSPSDSKSFLPALRHLWSLAVEPRCLIARDVDTKEIVSLPVKIRVKEGANTIGTQFMSPTLLPELDRLLSIKVDTPRYWPLLLDANIPRHRVSLLHSRTLFVKRRTAFLGYAEDPKGCRSLLVRSGSSTGEAAQLDFPHPKDPESRSTYDLQDIIGSFANDNFFLAFADRFCKDDGSTQEEKLFQAFCHAALIDCMTQDKPTTLQAHLLLFRARIMSSKSRYFPLMVQDLRFAAEFYSKTYERKFSGKFDNTSNPATNIYRPPLIRESQVLGALHTVDEKLQKIRREPAFLETLKKYVRGEVVRGSEEYPSMERHLAWYLLRENVPPAMHLRALHSLGAKAFKSIIEANGTTPDAPVVQPSILEDAMRLMMNTTGAQMVAAGWTSSSLEEVMARMADLDLSASNTHA